MDSTGWLAAAQKLDALEEHGATLEDLNTAIAELSAAVELGIPAPERLGAFSALSHALRRRFCRCEASADALACAQAAHRAVPSQPAVPPGAVLYYAQMLSVVYEVAGDLNALATAASLFDKLVREPGTGAFEPPMAGLAESCLLHYQRAGNANDLDEAFGLTLPVRYTAMDPPPNSIYVQACALRERYRRTGSLRRGADRPLSNLSGQRNTAACHGPDSRCHPTAQSRGRNGRLPDGARLRLLPRRIRSGTARRDL